ncbi:uncharacterized protein CDV56_103863 [Aspergillus thermomutatus]|uniref:Uncharacterized protein n=1 Tax=Aspergillus thermomutatus TaxID=41047 RepID=A0A397GY65_ASPTH|nr:uncharacterized protein CDV56_103863 [Aspergillus thermomutatus]RHZ52990.1 hypothetical protein CDV56_103863 [Aspergillus thermomutatus]
MPSIHFTILMLSGQRRFPTPTNAAHAFPCAAGPYSSELQDSNSIATLITVTGEAIQLISVQPVKNGTDERYATLKDLQKRLQQISMSESSTIRRMRWVQHKSSMEKVDDRIKDGRLRKTIADREISHATLVSIPKPQTLELDAAEVEKEIVRIFAEDNDYLEDFGFTPIHIAVLDLYDASDSERPKANNAPPERTGHDGRPDVKNDHRYKMRILVARADPFIQSNLNANIIHAAVESNALQSLAYALEISRC